MLNAFTLYRVTLVAAAAASLMLVACSRNEDEQLNSGQKADVSPIALVGAKTDEVANKAKRALDDATITAAVKTQLATDPVLSTLMINVSTQSGLVELKGKAPDVTVRERATLVAIAVKGVLSVENRLTVDGASA